jgi:SAM-dependent methyltransferase
MTYAETDLVASIEALAGVDVSALSRGELEHVDQFHAGGSAAVDRLLPSLGLGPGRTALDVGSGLGGPARQIALATGCAVVGVDVTASYVDAARALTDAAGLGGRVEFLCAELASVERDDFDAAYTIHVQMNVEDKTAFHREIAKRLRPGAPLAVFEVCRRGPVDPAVPLPWSLDGTDSVLATPADLRTSLRDAGLEEVEWVDETPWVRQWFDQIGARLADPRARATLPALLDEGPVRMFNFAVALADGVLTVHRGVFRRPGQEGIATR